MTRRLLRAPALLAVLLATIAGACSERLDTADSCPVLCPGQQLDIVETARLPLSDLRDEFGPTVSRSSWGNLGPTVVRWFDGARPLLTDAKIGTVMPLLWSTIGHVFLAVLAGLRPLFR